MKIKIPLNFSLLTPSSSPVAQEEDKADRSSSPKVQDAGRRKKKKGSEHGRVEEIPMVGSTGIRKRDCQSETRWLLPAKSSRQMVVVFAGEKGRTEQELLFGILGSPKIIRLRCVGLAGFPQIKKDPKSVFEDILREKKPKEKALTATKQYHPGTKTFEFGHLLAGKPREGYLEGKFPENSTKFHISNPGPMDAEMEFCFQKDNAQNTFLMSPSSLQLKAGETLDLSVWAFPKGPGPFDDAVVCLIRDNPEPVVFPISCVGSRPMVDLESSQLDFGKVLVEKRASQAITLANKSALPLLWKVVGTEALTDFTFFRDLWNAGPDLLYLDRSLLLLQEPSSSQEGDQAGGQRLSESAGDHPIHPPQLGCRGLPSDGGLGLPQGQFQRPQLWERQVDRGEQAGRHSQEQGQVQDGLQIRGDGPEIVQCGAVGGHYQRRGEGPASHSGLPQSRRGGYQEDGGGAVQADRSTHEPRNTIPSGQRHGPSSAQQSYHPSGGSEMITKIKTTSGVKLHN